MVPFLIPNTCPGADRHANMPLGAPEIAFLGVDSSTVTAFTAADTSVEACTMRQTNPSEKVIDNLCQKWQMVLVPNHFLSLLKPHTVPITLTISIALLHNNPHTLTLLRPTHIHFFINRNTHIYTNPSSTTRLFSS